MPKISELVQATAANINNDDLLLIVDKKTQETKQIDILEFAKVIASILDIKIKQDAGADRLERRPLPANRICGQKVSVDKMISVVMVDRFSFAGNSETITMNYNMSVEKKRITIVGRYGKHSAGSIVLYDTEKGVSGPGSITFCKYVGITTVDIYIRSKSRSGFEYTLVCGGEECVQYNEPIITATPTATPYPTPTPTATQIDFSLVDPSPTPSPTPSLTPSLTPSITPSSTPSP